MALLSFSGSPHGGLHKLLPEWNSQPKITPTTIIDHSIVGSALGAYLYFRDKTGIESHFIIDLDGEIWQLMSTDRQADANWDANDYAISIETADNGDPNNFPWTAQQLASLKWLHNKLVAIHPTIHRKKVTSCTSGGLGYHSLLGAPSCFTPSAGKTCPGKPVRVSQWNNILVPAFLNQREEEDMTSEQAAQLKAIHDVLLLGHVTKDIPIDNLFNNANNVHSAMVVPGTTSAEQAFNMLFERVRNISAAVGALSDDEANILAAIGAIPAGGGGSITDAQARLMAEQLLAALPAKVVDELSARLTNG